MGAECKYELSQSAYIKLVLHSLKHRSSAVNGLLWGTSPATPTPPPPSRSSMSSPCPTPSSASSPPSSSLSSWSRGILGQRDWGCGGTNLDLRGPAKNIGDQIFRSFPRAAVLLLDAEKMKELPKQKGLDLVVQTSEKCENFVKWCDEVGKIQSHDANSLAKLGWHRGTAEAQYPECMCTAGLCRVETVQCGEFKGCRYFVCHLKTLDMEKMKEMLKHKGLDPVVQKGALHRGGYPVRCCSLFCGVPYKGGLPPTAV